MSLSVMKNTVVKVRFFGSSENVQKEKVLAILHNFG